MNKITGMIGGALGIAGIIGGWIWGMAVFKTNFESIAKEVNEVKEDVEEVEEEVAEEEKINVRQTVILERVLEELKQLNAKE